MKKLLVGLLAAVLLLSASNKAVLDNSKVTGYNIAGETENYLELGFNVRDINYSDVTTEKGVFTSVNIDEGTLAGITGTPAMPA